MNIPDQTTLWTVVREKDDRTILSVSTIYPTRQEAESHANVLNNLSNPPQTVWHPYPLEFRRVYK